MAYSERREFLKLAGLVFGGGLATYALHRMDPGNRDLSPRVSFGTETKLQQVEFDESHVGERRLFVNLERILSEYKGKGLLSAPLDPVPQVSELVMAGFQSEDLAHKEERNYFLYSGVKNEQPWRKFAVAITRNGRQIVEGGVSVVFHNFALEEVTPNNYPENNEEFMSIGWWNKISKTMVDDYNSHARPVIK